MSDDRTGPLDSNGRAERLERRLTVPVVVAAALSVPAVFLAAIAEGALAVFGLVLNWASMAVLTAESVILFMLAGDRLTWVRRHGWPLLVTALAVPAVILALAPVQALRVLLSLARHLAALRVLRAKRLVSAGRVVARRLGPVGRWRHFPVAAGSAAAAIFVALVLADPDSVRAHRRALAAIFEWAGVWPALAAGCLLAITALLLAAWRRRGRDCD